MILEHPRSKIKGRDLEDVLADLRKGKSSPTIAARYDVHPCVIRDIARKAGIPISCNKNPVALKDAAIRELAKTCNPDEIADRIGSSRSAVRRYMEDNGIAWDKRKRKKWTEAEAKQVEKMAKGGATCTEVAREFGVKRSAMYEFAKKRDIRFQTNRWRTQENLDRLFDMWLNGYRAALAASEIGMPTSTAGKMFSDWDEFATADQRNQREAAMSARYLYRTGRKSSHSTAKGEAA